MKLIPATSMLLAASATSTIVETSSSRKKSKSAAGVRLLQKLASTSKERQLQLFGSSFGASDNCGTTCTTPGLCSSFMGFGVDLAASCDAGCIPDFAFDSCDVLCSNDGTVDMNANTDAVVTAEQRIGVFGLTSASDLMCGNCNFYKCCVGVLSYDKCKSNLPDVDSLFSDDMDEDWGIQGGFDIEIGDWDIGDSGFEELIDSIIPDDWGIVWDDSSSSSVASVTEHASGLSVLGQVVDSFVCPQTCADESLCETIFSGEADDSLLAYACNNGCLPTVSSCEEFCGGDNDMACDACKFLACCSKGGQSTFEVCQDFIPRLNYALSGSTALFAPDPDLDSAHGGIGSSWGGSDSASGISVLGVLFADLNCPETCNDTNLCNSFFLGMGDEEVLSKACNSGCLPEVPSCNDICENANEVEFMGSVVDMACDSCNFLDCCAGDDDFDVCKKNLPEMGNLLIDWDTSLVGDWSHSGLIELDWEDIEEALGGLSNLAEDLHSLVDDALIDFDYFPVTCNPKTCPIAGACDMSYDMANLNFENVCEGDAIFKCMEGLKEMCTSECDQGTANNWESAAFCSLCDIATCCEDNGNSTSFEGCVLEATPQSVTDVFNQLPSVLEDLQDFVEEVVGDLSIPEFCPEVDGAAQCEVEGFCGIFNGDFTNFDMEDTCNNNAFFKCGPEDLEGKCTEQCGTGTDADTAIMAESRLASNLLFDAPFCSLCSVARCCRDKAEGASFLDACALDTLPEQFTTAHTSTSGQDVVEAPSSDSIAEDSKSVESTLAETAQSDSGAKEAVTSDTIMDTTSPGPILAENEIPEDTPVTTDNNSTSGSDVTLPSIESSVGRLDDPDSASFFSGISVGIAIASITTLALVSF